MAIRSRLVWWFSLRRWSLSARRWFVWERFYYKGYVWTPLIYIKRRREYVYR